MNYDVSHAKIADDGIIKREIFRTLLEGPCNRRDLRWKLGLRGYRISSKAVDYHLRRGKKGLINEGIVREDRRALYPIFSSISMTRMVRYVLLDPKIETRFNKNLSYAFLQASTFLGAYSPSIFEGNIERYEKAIEDAKNERISDIDETVKLILRAYEYDVFLDDISKTEAFLNGAILNFASVSSGSMLFEKMRHDYEEAAAKRFWKNLSEPSLNDEAGYLDTHLAPSKRDLLRKIQDVSKVLWIVENTHLDAVMNELAGRAEKVFKRSTKIAGLSKTNVYHLWHMRS